MLTKFLRKVVRIFIIEKREDGKNRDGLRHPGTVTADRQKTVQIIPPTLYMHIYRHYVRPCIAWLGHAPFLVGKW